MKTDKIKKRLKLFLSIDSIGIGFCFFVSYILIDNLRLYVGILLIFSTFFLIFFSVINKVYDSISDICDILLDMANAMLTIKEKIWNKKKKSS